MNKLDRAIDTLKAMGAESISTEEIDIPVIIAPEWVPDDIKNKAVSVTGKFPNPIKIESPEVIQKMLEIFGKSDEPNYITPDEDGLLVKLIFYKIGLILDEERSHKSC